jgi:hypothetical protein
MQRPEVSRSSGGERAGHGIVAGMGDSGPGNYGAALHLAVQLSGQRKAGLTLVHGCLPRLSWHCAMRRWSATSGTVRSRLKSQNRRCQPNCSS